MSWYEYVALVVIVFLVTGLVVYFGHRYYGKRRGNRAQAQPNSDSERRRTSSNRRNNQRSETQSRNTTGNTNRRSAAEPKSDDEEDEPNVIFTISHREGGSRSTPTVQNTQPTAHISTGARQTERPRNNRGNQAPRNQGQSNRTRTAQTSLSDAQIVGTDPPPSYQEAITETRRY